jgi:hypothetical protein
LRLSANKNFNQPAFYGRAINRELEYLTGNMLASLPVRLATLVSPAALRGGQQWVVRRWNDCRNPFGVCAVSLHGKLFGVGAAKHNSAIQGSTRNIVGDHSPATLACIRRDSGRLRLELEGIIEGVRLLGYSNSVPRVNGAANLQRNRQLRGADRLVLRMTGQFWI